MPESPIKKLLVDKRDVAESVASGLQGFLSINKSDYSPVLPIPLSNLSLRDRILLELGTAYLAFVGDLRKESGLSRQTLKQRCKGTDSGIRGTLSKLRTAGLVKSPEKGDEITIQGLLELRRILLGSKHNQDKEVQR